MLVRFPVFLEIGEFAAKFGVPVGEGVAEIGRKVIEIPGGFEMDFHFVCRTYGYVKMMFKFFFESSFGPAFRNICRAGFGGAADL